MGQTKDKVEVRVGQVLTCKRKSFLPREDSGRKVYCSFTVGRSYEVMRQHPEWRDVFYLRDDTGKEEGFATSRIEQMFKLIKDI